MEFIERLEVCLKDRTFVCEATPVFILINGDEETEEVKYKARVFEDGALANAGNTPNFTTIEDAIQFGFNWCKETVR